jgi:O-antigen biosynthesis protein
MDISLVIVSYNAPEYLKKCLFSVQEALEGIDSEVFVVDNNSSDGTCDIVGELFPRVTLIKNNINRGFAAACNQALSISKGRYKLLLNPDTVLEKNVLRECIEFMDSHPDAGSAGVRMVNGDGKFLRESKRSFPTAFSSFFKITGIAGLFPRIRFINGYYHPDIEEQEPYRVEVLTGAFMFIRSSALESAGLLDEDFFMYGEDIDLSYRIIKAGYNNYYLPSLRILHYKGRSTPLNGYSDISHFYNAMRIYIRKRKSDGDFRNISHLLTGAVYIREYAARSGRFLKLLSKHL